MKKLLCLVFALAMVCGLLFAFSVNAEEGTTNNIASEATITTSSGSWWITGNLKNMVDGKEDTGMHSSNTDRETSVTFTFDSARYVTKIVLKVNGTATTSAISHTDLNANTDYQITINGTTTTLNALDKTELVLDVNASMSEMSIQFVSNWSANNALIREVEIYEYIPPVVEAATGNNIEDDATIAIVDGNDYILGGAEYLRDNDPSTGLSAGDAASWINYHFLYERPRAITKVKVVVNSTGTMYMVGSADGTYVHETMSALPNIYLRLYSSTSGTNNVYAVEGVSTANAVEVTKDGKTYMEYTFDLGGALYEDIVKVEIATVHNKDNTLGVWEVEIIDFQCQSDEDHKYADATCSTPATCIYCLATTGEPSGEHTMLPANCGQPARCQYCDYTEGDVTGEPHTWLNASYTAPKLCKVCGTTEGDVWVDSDLEGFIRGPENDMITYDDIIGEVTLINGTNAKGVPEYVLDGITDNASQYWGGPTNTQIKITLKHEWEITDAKLYLFANWASMKVGFYAADGTLLGEKNIGALQCNYAWFDGAVEADPTYTDYSSAINNLTYGNEDKAVKYIIITNTADKWGWVPGVVEVYFSGRERIPFAGCVTHDFEATYPVEPTCTTEGTLVNKCTVCGAEEAPVVAPALGHNMSEYTIKTPANCNTAAIIEFSCTRCGETTERPTHINDVTDYADIETAESNGAGGWTTSHKALFDNNMDSYLHASGGWFVESWIELDMPYYITSVTVWTGSWGDNNSWEANFTFYYQAPGSDEWIEVSPKKAAGVIKANTKYEHTLELDTPVYADAIKIKVDRLASFQGQAFEAEVAGTLFPETAPLGHTWEVTEVVAAACDAGYTLSTCTVCGETKTDAYTKAVGHIWADATCVAPKTCSVCGVTDGEALGHSYFYACDKVCQVCGEESNPDATHTLVHVDAKAATCTENGNVEYWYCSVCGYAWLDEACTQVTNQMSIVVPATGHSYFYPCDVVCMVCYEETNPDATHTLVHVDAKAATCTENGNVEYWYCSDCGSAWTDEALTQVTNQRSVITPATGHSYFYPCDVVCMVCYEETNPDATHNIVHVEAVAATCTANGNVEYWYCSDCGSAWTDEALTQVTNQMSVRVPKTEHSYVEVERVPAEPGVAGSVTYTCLNCGDTYSEEIEALPEHTHTEVEIPAIPSTADANKVVTPGMTSGIKCSECGEVLVAPVVTDAGLTIDARSLNISESIKIIYKCYIPAGYSNVYMTFDFNGKVHTVTDYTVDGNGRYCFTFTGVTPQYMNINICATVYAENNDQVSAFVNPEYSVKTYCTNNLAKNLSASLNALLTDLLVYGEMLQYYVTTGTVDNPITDGVDLTNKSEFTPLDGSFDKRTESEETSEIAYWDTVSLNIASSVNISFKFYATNIEGLEVKVTVKNRTTTYNASDLELDSKGRYVVLFTNVTAVEFDEVVTAEFYVNGEKIDGTMTYSVNSYIQRYQDYSNVKLTNFLKALYNYGLSAYKYVNKGADYQH